MKALRIVIVVALLIPAVAKSQEMAIPSNFWQIGFGLGELPTGGSFKPSITLGYHFNDKIYVGMIYQFKDDISRNSESINARSADLDGLATSTESVAQRFLFQVRYKPIKKGPYLSGGFVFNGKDTETMSFDARERRIGEETYEGSVVIKQTRPAGWGLALGLGYQYDFNNGFSGGFEWTPAWGQYPSPSYAFGGSSDLSNSSRKQIQNKMDDEFTQSVTNMYKVFHIGLAYRFQ
ncbi:MAG: hypothetical protein R8N23_00810 [Reichenbachiella sp.]|uniref:hypothetical protein n=1 Tax=Reichenbachiella sp. TaxID=2184521 RepID=UPI00296608AC|nr:hypothetical protein [Reichenbachiella sp.]MDW3208375.1 hypothetical protein [Reichenbachiella sp.]